MPEANGQVMMEKNVNLPANRGTQADVEEHSDIAQFYTGCNVFITGGSGFLGKILIEKLLRSCPKVGKVYILVRAKKGKTPEERFKEHFEDVLYDKLKKERPNFVSQVVMIEGQFQDGLVLSPENRECLKNSHIVFHGAATVRFDEKLRFAVNVNVRGTRDMLLFAKEMPNLKAFVHIGTAFSHCVIKFIDEIFYKPPIGADELLSLVDSLDDEILDRITLNVLGKWPNTYAFTKTIAEDAVRKYGQDLPLCIVRPSIMIATAHEPIRGWVNNLYGPTGVVAGAGVGLLHTLHCDAKNVADIIPADYVINNILAAAWNIGTEKRQQPQHLKQLPPPAFSLDTDDLNPTEDPPIYNSVSSCQNPTTWGEFMKYNAIFGIRIPSMRSFWYYYFHLHKNIVVHYYFIALTHLLPALIGDTVARLTGRKPILWDTYKKIHKFSGVISYFAMQEWMFRNKNVVHLWHKLSPVDQKIFYFNLTGMDWKRYYYHHIRGVRRFIIGEPLETVPAARKKYVYFTIAHYVILTLARLFVVWLAYRIVCLLLALFI